MAVISRKERKKKVKFRILLNVGSNHTNNFFQMNFRGELTLDMMPSNYFSALKSNQKRKEIQLVDMSLTFSGHHNL